MTSVQAPAVTPIESRGYAKPEVLVSTDWVAQHLNDPKVRLVESNEDILLYDTGHIPGAVKVDWTSDLNDQLVRDYVDRDRLQKLLRSKGINNDTTIVFYGDKNNWWATYALWVLKLFGVQERAGDGRRAAPLGGRGAAALDRQAPATPRATSPWASGTTPRSARSGTRCSDHLKKKGQLVDVRSPEELQRPEDPHARVPAGGLPPRRAHPRAPRASRGPRRSIPRPTPSSRRASSGSSTSRTTPSKKDQETIAYCRIGERSSHTWFALTYLLGFDNVRNYDGSWTEWGNAVRLPVER